ncbi:MAG: 3'(2'),5'-bisphosphate nucleotidase CysQ [Amphiplicatus sp.]
MLRADSHLLDSLIDIARQAAAEIMTIYASDFAVETKDDASPVTEADRRAETIILKGLASAAPGVPVLAEESAAAGRGPALGETFFLVDPLDGTREFIGRNGEFTVNIALIHRGAPVLGVVHAPATERLYAGGEDIGAFRLDLACAKRTAIKARRPEGGLVAVVSRSHRTAKTDAYLQNIGATSFVEAGSSLKFCLIAEGAADIYPRLGRTMEWDTGAGQAVLEAAGGRVVVHPSGERLTYGKTERGFDNPSFVAWGGA